MSCTLHNIGNMYLYRYSRAEGAENAGLESAGLENAGPGKRRCIYEIKKSAWHTITTAKMSRESFTNFGLHWSKREKHI